MIKAWQLAKQNADRIILLENNTSESHTIDLQNVLMVGNNIDKEILIDTPEHFNQDEGTWTLNILLPNDEYCANLTVGLLQKVPWPLGKTCTINFKTNDKIRGTVILTAQGSQFCKFIITNQQDMLNIHKYDYTAVTVSN